MRSHRLLPAASIRGTLVALIAIVAVPLVGLGAYGVVYGYRERRDAEVEASAEVAREISLAVEAFVVDIVRVEQTLGVTSADHLAARIEGDLRAVLAKHAEIRDLSWIGPDGTVVASTEPALAGRSLFAREYFQEIRRGAEWRVSPVMQSVVDGAPLFVVACGVRGASGELRAVVSAAIGADALGVVLGRRSGGGWTAVVDGAGTLVAMAPERPLDWETRRRTSEHPWIVRALAGEEMRGAFRAATTGELRLGAVVPIRRLGWVAHASRPRAQILGEARRYAARFGVAALAVAIAALAAASLLASRIAGPLRTLEHHAAELGQGSPGPLRVRGPLEVRRVARALDAMAASLSRRRAELEAAHRDAQDATERAQARGAELDAIVAALPVGLVVLDASGKAARVNDVAVEILGLEDRDLALTPAERWARCRPARADGSPLGSADHPAVRALAGETVRGEVVRIERRGGGRAWIAASAAPIRSPDGHGRGAVLTIVDVTQLRGLEEERDTLIHTVSHDLRTPLHVIVSHAELLRRRGDEEARHRADAILASAGRMTRLVGDLVDAARLETGRVQLHLEAIDLARFLPAWRERVTGALPMQRVRVSTPGTIPAVVADPARLDQILANLVSNALKYSPDDAAVDVELARAGKALRLSVRDRGPGIAPEDLPRVFDRYWRGRSTARAEGLGLGLFITRRLVEAHGWTIEAASALGEGSVFTVVVPLERTRAAPAEGAAA